MTTISIHNLSFAYPGQPALFSHLNLDLNTDWRLGLLGRNGRGKTTMMQLLMGQFSHQGTIASDVHFAYYPLSVNDQSELAGEALIEASGNLSLEQWQIERELNLMHTNPDILWQPYWTLSGGERTKCQLATLFAQPKHFFLLDEPTNHLDIQGRQIVVDYLKKKQQGFIITSHDQDFVDQLVNHTLVIENQNVVLEQGNYTTYFAQKQRRDQTAIHTNQQLAASIKSLQKERQQRQQWAQRAENEKRHNSHADKGFIGAKAAKMMKKTISTTHRLDQAISQKRGLLTEVESIAPLTINLQPTHHHTLLDINQLSLKVHERTLFKPVSCCVSAHDQVALLGPNGAGKSSIVKAIQSQFDGRIDGEIQLAQGLKISYVRQDFSGNHGSLESFAKENSLEYNTLLNLLRKLGMARQTFQVPIEKMSMGQQKRVEIAKSLAMPANLYIWDEPLNYLDTYNQQQLIQLIQESRPPLLFVEHDTHFIQAIASQKVHVHPVLTIRS